MFQGQPSRHSAVFFQRLRHARHPSEQSFVSGPEVDHLGIRLGGAL